MRWLGHRGCGVLDPGLARFMQEIQHALHEARKTGVEDALAPVAEAIARDVRLLAFDEMQITDITDGAMIVGRLFESCWRRGW